MALIQKLFSKFSSSARAARAKTFRSLFELDVETTVLDLGSQDGKNIDMVLKGSTVEPANVCIADIYPDAIAKGKAEFGFRGAVIDESGRLPFGDSEFDVVYCSSVIEHVTLPKSEIWRIRSGREFRERSLSSQKAFADEVRRVGKSYFVQTPARSFPLESHTWLPLAGYLPRSALIAVLKLFNRLWSYPIDPDFNLLGRREMEELFPDATVIRERSFGMTKSWMAVKSRVSERPELSGNSDRSAR